MIYSDHGLYIKSVKHRIKSRCDNKSITKDQTAIRVVERIAGNVVLADAFRALTNIP